MPPINIGADYMIVYAVDTEVAPPSGPKHLFTPTTPPRKSSNAAEANQLTPILEESDVGGQYDAPQSPCEQQKERLANGKRFLEPSLSPVRNTTRLGYTFLLGIRAELNVHNSCSI
jgi:hypothetical protein